MDMGAYMCIASNGVPPTVSKRIDLGIDCEYLNDDLLTNSTLGQSLP